MLRLDSNSSEPERTLNVRTYAYVVPWLEKAVVEECNYFAKL